jgi:pyrroline-5-carboxylate reductase
MRIGVIGAGNMAGALVRGWAAPVLVYDPLAGAAASLAAEVGGEAVGSNGELAERADLVVLCHKPDKLEAVAVEARAARAVVSVLGGTAVADVERAYPEATVYRFMPNVAAEVRRGVFCYVGGSRAGEGPESEVLDLFGRLGTVVPVAETHMDAATALMGCGPAFYALVVEALVDAGVRHGLPPDAASLMAVDTMAGAAAVLEARGRDTSELRRRVTSPGGSTARGLAALERGGVRAAFAAAVDAVTGDERR